jgi:hypothetical protein
MQWTLYTLFHEIYIFISTFLILIVFYSVGMFDSFLKVYFMSVFSQKLKLKVFIQNLKLDLWSGRCEFDQVTVYHPPPSVDPRWRSEVMAHADQIICTFDPLLSLYGYLSGLLQNKKFAFFDTISVKGIDLFVEGYESETTAAPAPTPTAISTPHLPGPPVASLTPTIAGSVTVAPASGASTVAPATTTTTGPKTTLNLKLIGGEQKNFQRLRKPTHVDIKNQERLEKRRRRQQLAQERAQAAAQTIRGRSGSITSSVTGRGQGVDGSSHGSGQAQEHQHHQPSAASTVSGQSQASPIVPVVEAKVSDDSLSYPFAIY